MSTVYRVLYSNPESRRVNILSRPWTFCRSSSVGVAYKQLLTPPLFTQRSNRLCVTHHQTPLLSTAVFPRPKLKSKTTKTPYGNQRKCGWWSSDTKPHSHPLPLKLLRACDNNKMVSPPRSNRLVAEFLRESDSQEFISWSTTNYGKISFS